MHASPEAIWQGPALTWNGPSLGPIAGRTGRISLLHNTRRCRSATCPSLYSPWGIPIKRRSVVTKRSPKRDGHLSLLWPSSLTTLFRWLCYGGTKLLSGSTWTRWVRSPRSGGLRFYSSVAKLAQGWALARRDQSKEGIILLREGMNSVWAAGMKVQAPFQLALLGDAYDCVKDARQGLLCVGKALARAEETGERWYDAELYRLKGDLLAHEDPVSAQSCYRHATAIARDQAAKMWELRAATSLARLWGEQRRRTMAYELLAPVYGWFTEGFDTADLKDAKALLDELS
jgi:hypothetical protein